MCVSTWFILVLRCEASVECSIFVLVRCLYACRKEMVNRLAHLLLRWLWVGGHNSITIFVERKTANVTELAVEIALPIYQWIVFHAALNEPHPNATAAAFVSITPTQIGINSPKQTHNRRMEDRIVLAYKSNRPLASARTPLARIKYA